MHSTPNEILCRNCFASNGEDFDIYIRYSIDGETLSAATKALIDREVRNQVFAAGRVVENSNRRLATSEIELHIREGFQNWNCGENLPRLHSVRAVKTVTENGLSGFEIESCIMGTPASVGDTRTPQSIRPYTTQSETPFLDGFDFVKNLGNGTFGTVWVATCRSIGVHRVIKSVAANEDSTNEVSAIQRLMNLHHPNIVKVLAIEVSGNRLHFVMEHKTETTLHDQIKLRGRITLRDAMCILRQLTSAVATAHQARVFHCDIKPKNILYTTQQAQPFVQLCDFGIARVLGARNAEIPANGTGGYRSTVSTSGDDRDLIANDIFSIAATLYSMLTGRIRFHDAEPFDFHLIPWALRASLSNALARSPSDRPSSLSAFVESVDSAVTVQLPRFFHDAIQSNHRNSAMFQAAAAYVQHSQDYKQASLLISGLSDDTAEEIRHWLRKKIERKNVLERRLRDSLSVPNIAEAKSHIEHLHADNPANEQLNELLGWLSSYPDNEFLG